jgi:DNA-binding NtrC family response regulator
VLKAKDAQSALAIVESGVPVDMLFTDVVMPGPLRSTELARKARERLPAVAVLFTSGYADNAIVHSGRLDEGIELLSKPYTHEALARKVRYVLQTQNPQAAELAALEQQLLQAGSPVTPAGVESFAADARMRILLVEDDELIRESTAELLRTFDFDILEAEGEHDAKRILSEHAINVMLTDVGLAGKSGVDLAMDVCGDRPDLRVIFLTGSDLVLTPEQRKVLPQAILLRKPYDLLDLIDAVKTPLS